MPAIAPPQRTDLAAARRLCVATSRTSWAPRHGLTTRWQKVLRGQIYVRLGTPRASRFGYHEGASAPHPSPVPART